MPSSIMSEYAPKQGALHPIKYLKEVKLLIQMMPYGDLMEMATASESDPAKLWKWANEMERVHDEDAHLADTHTDVSPTKGRTGL